jgi:hypothetical protein
MALFQAYLYTYSLLRGVTFEVLPLSSCALSPTMLPLLETFLELLLWSSFQCRRHICCEYLQCPVIFVPLRQTLFFETEVIRSQIRGIGWVFHFRNRFLGQKLLDRERLMSWSIVMAENPIGGPKFRPFSTHNFAWPLQYFHIISLADCLALWNEFKVNSTLDIE